MKLRWRIKNFFPHSNELFICAYPKNLVKMGLIVEVMDTFCGSGQQGTAYDSRGQQGMGRDSIDNLSPSLIFALIGLAWLWLRLRFVKNTKL